MIDLPQKPTLLEVQQFMANLEKEKGWDKDTILQKCLMLGEEVGELFKVVRKDYAGVPVEVNGTNSDQAEELADILMLVCFIANRMSVDLEEALRSKNQKNESRRWK